ncbi:MAG: efflux RND transporter periplasmic adaptor subunit [Candidatus Dadabacteria bacterium]|nr:MAG: efflux RND transporter periplasmic adaptor subunit [Candidatus Dadabacteria bacterium]
MKEQRKALLKYFFLFLGILLLILWTGNFFNFSLIKPGTTEASQLKTNLKFKALHTVKKVPVNLFETALGVIESKRHTTVSARVTGQVLKVLVEPSDFVKKGDLLVQLDDRELKAKFARIKSHFERVKRLYKAKAATKAEFEAALSEFTQTEVALSYTKITAPFTGIISEKLAEPGDLAWHGKGLLKLYDPEALRVTADVREGLISQIKKGKKYQVTVPSVNVLLEGELREIIPSADPGSRTLRVHLDLGKTEGVYPGMFAKVTIPLGKKEAVVVPQSAIKRVGQLEFVWVKDKGGFYKRIIKTGRFILNKGIEVVSGLNGGERIALF